MSRSLIIVLQSRQPLTVDLTEAFPPEDHDVIVLTDGNADAVMREDAPGTLPEVVVLERSRWAERIGDLAEKANGPIEIVTNDEYTLTDCARLRSGLALASRHPPDLAAYRDKVTMKRLLRAAGVRVPRFHAFEPTVTDATETQRRVVAEVGIPMVAKPRREANSRGVEILLSAGELAHWLARHRGEQGWQVDEYIEGTHHHVNGLVYDGQVVPVQVGDYMGPLLGLEKGRLFGGRTLPSGGGFAETAHELNRRVVGGLGGAGSFVVHTEFMVDPAAKPVVLEVAARAPGALVSQTARLHAGLNLEVAQLRLQAGLPVPRPASGDLHAAWMWIPVLPGQRFNRAPTFASDSKIHVRRAGRQGHCGPNATVGASLLLWQRDVNALACDIDTAHSAPWFVPV